MGQLGGNEPIPEGQKFRVKATGEYLKTNEKGTAYIEGYNKEEIEPVFE